MGISKKNKGKNEIITKKIKTKDGVIKAKIFFSDFWKEWQLFIDGSFYGNFNGKEEAIEELNGL